MSLYRLARITLDVEPDVDVDHLRHEVALLVATMAAEWEKGEPIRSCVREIFVPDGPDETD